MSPDKVGRYKIKAELGRGGMGRVYRAHDPISNREVAIKVLPSEMLHNLVTRARFKRELKLVASLEHPAIVPVYDVGEENDQPFFVMRYMSGGSLAAIIKKGRLSLSDAAVIIERLASALDHAHEKGIIHRDIKPDNVLFDAGNNPYLSDFGVAKFMEAPVSVTDAGPQEAMGTPAYISPEQARGENIDHRADIYGLGAILYEMLTGERPYAGDTVISVAIQHVNDPIPSVLKARPELPAEVDTIIKTAMAKDKDGRYPNAVDLALALNKVTFGEERTIPSLATLNGRQNTSASPSKQTGWIVMALLLLAGIGGWFGLRGQLPLPFAAAPTPSASITAVPPTAEPTMTSTMAPTLTPIVTPTVEEATPVVPSIPGGADKVAFVAGNQVYVMNMDGSELIQLRTDNSAKSGLHWIADGRLVYLARNCAYIVDVQIEQPEEIVCFDASESLEGFRVSRDGKMVAISIQRTLNILPFDIDIFNDVESRFNLLALENNCFYNQFAFREVLWSKDGTRLAAHVVDTELVSSDQIFLLSVDIPNCATVGPVRIDRIPGGHIDFDSKSTKRITSYDWDGEHLFLLNDSLRNDGFGDLYFYNSQTREAAKINPVDGICCYRDARWSPNGDYIFFSFQPYNGSEIQLYYLPFPNPESEDGWAPIQIPDILFTNPREKPQPALRPAP
ncbi:MAG TPA: serine/threonine-protein kinase [Anaerolineales bacterium]|nr:serine/threonine-protein kinase [Anaerolineales bacterium]